jgi:hypothetical protein
VLEQADFKNLVGEIIRREFPDQQDVFSLRGDDYIARLYRGDTAKPKVDQHLGLAFGGKELTQILEMIAAIWGTFKIVTEIWGLFKSQGSIDGAAIERRWKQRLIDEGMDAALAAKLSSDFCGELVTLLQAKRSG